MQDRSVVLPECHRFSVFILAACAFVGCDSPSEAPAPTRASITGNWIGTGVGGAAGLGSRSVLQLRTDGSFSVKNLPYEDWSRGRVVRLASGNGRWNVDRAISGRHHATWELSLRFAGVSPKGTFGYILLAIETNENKLVFRYGFGDPDLEQEVVFARTAASTRPTDSNIAD